MQRPSGMREDMYAKQKSSTDCRNWEKGGEGGEEEEEEEEEEYDDDDDDE